MENTIDVTVAVCTYNRPLALRRALASVVLLEGAGQWRHEVLVVDNASTDDTAQVIEEAARTSPVPLRGVYEPRKGIAAARNRAIREARGQWVAFFDDDQVAHAGWITALLKIAREKGVRCAGGATRPVLDEEGLPELPAMYCGLLGPKADRKKPGRYHLQFCPGAGNMLIHRSVFDEIGGFDESLTTSGEDTDLFRRIYAKGIEAWYTPEAIVYHAVPPYRMTDRYLRWKWLGYGRNVACVEAESLTRVEFLLRIAARAARAALMEVPLLAAARLLRARGRALKTRCRLWRAEGYLRTALQRLAPRRFAQEEFFASLEFRSERESFSP